MSIVEPLKLYLDTNHLINIAKVRKAAVIPDEVRTAYSAIDEYIRSWQVGLIFQPTTVLEWVDGNATIESANEIAEVVDSAKLQYEFDTDTFVYLHEVLRELKRLDSNLCLPDYEILHVRAEGKLVRRGLGVLLHSVPEFFDDCVLPPGSESLPVEMPFGSARSHVQQSWSFQHDRPAMSRERVEGHFAAYGEDLAIFQMRKKKPVQADDIVGWMKRFLNVDRILTKLNTDVNVDRLLRSVEIQRCPAIDLYIKAHQKRLRAGNNANENDADDWSSVVPVVPYADLVLTERSLRAFIVQADPSLDAKVAHDPNRIATAIAEYLKIDTNQR
jgi:hypothetical protein